MDIEEDCWSGKYIADILDDPLKQLDEANGGKTAKDSTSSSPREFDWEVQRAQIAEEHWRRHNQWCESLADESLLPIDHRRVALKLLVNEAFRRCYRHAAQSGAAPQELRILKAKWTRVGKQVVQEMALRDNSASILRKLSSMCVFLPAQASTEYGENFEERIRRAAQQRIFLSQLRTQGLLFASA